ncbi:MAG: SUMF1/EgtB/PvdO family nonheme iron enzyme [Pirellulales bacterium]|nr:SUMF1/EgtB/PvdO family nonheme iron enzyme [Pirellulales bacterium]
MMGKEIQAKWLIAVLVPALTVTAAQAVTIETVPVGNVGNSADMRYNLVDRPEGYGAVNYSYNIGKYEVTAGQYCEFLNTVAASDPYGLYSLSMTKQDYTSMLVTGDGYVGCQITRHGTSGNYTYDFSGRHIGSEADWANRPVNCVDWADAARFVNWLHNGQGNGDTEDGVYDLSATHPCYDENGNISDIGGFNAAMMAVTRKPGAKWAIPTEDEWYKAAYHKNDGITGNYFNYPTGNDSVPSNDLVDPDPGNNATFYDSGYTVAREYEKTEVGAHEHSESPYGTFDQGGNVQEWTEAVVGTAGRGIKGGAYDSNEAHISAEERGISAAPFINTCDIGFRVVQVPEPGSLTLLLCGLASLVCLRRRR